MLSYRFNCTGYNTCSTGEVNTTKDKNFGHLSEDNRFIKIVS